MLGPAKTNLLEAHAHQKEDFIKRASKSQLARFVNDPHMASQISEGYVYGGDHREGA